MSIKFLARLTALALLVSLALLLTPATAPAGQVTAREILDRVDDLYRGRSSRGVMTMTITTAHWTRSLTLEAWTEGKDKSLIRILAPNKEKGTATLRVVNDIWNYLPKVNRVIKLPSSMMSASWMGSHFTNDDLVKESRMTEDFDFEVTFQGEKDGREILELTCIPKPEAAVVWGRILVVVQPVDYQPIRILYYDEDLNLARTMSFGGVRQFGDRTLPSLMTIVPVDKPQEKTEILYEEITFNLDLEPETFSLRSLTQ